MTTNKYKRRWTALRSAIQMGGESMPPVKVLEDFVAAVAFFLSDEDACKCIAFIEEEISPTQWDRGALPEADVEDMLDGYHWEDWSGRNRPVTEAHMQGYQRLLREVEHRDRSGPGVRNDHS